MSFRVLDALPLLVLHFRETINKVPDNRNGRQGLGNKKVMGFRTPSGKVTGLMSDKGSKRLCPALTVMSSFLNQVRPRTPKQWLGPVRYRT